jgi:Flavin reductase like domain
MKGKRLHSDSILIILIQVAYHPPIVSVSFRLSPRLPKNTRDNILATKQFVVNLISEPFAEAANETSVEAPADVSEWDISGLTQEPSVSSGGNIRLLSGRGDQSHLGPRQTSASEGERR